MVWVCRDDEGSGDGTRIIGFDKRMREKVRMVESGNDWTITNANGKTYEMKGNGCPDPLTFIMTLMSPRRSPADMVADLPFMRYRHEDSGEVWEVWEVR